MNRHDLKIHFESEGRTFAEGDRVFLLPKHPRYPEKRGVIGDIDFDEKRCFVKTSDKSGLHVEFEDPRYKLFIDMNHV